MNFMKISGIHNFGQFLESGRKSMGPPLPWPWPRPRPLPKTRAGAGADPHRRGRREAAADGCAVCAGSGPSARPLGAKQFRSRAGCVRSGPPIRSLGAKRFCERAVSARSGPPVRPSGQSDSGNAPDPCARGLRCVPRGKAIPGTRWVRTPGLRSACSGPSDLVARTWPRHC